jgi:hypothetical protein
MTISIFDDEASDYYIVRTHEVTVTDSKLSLDIGIWDYYIMINYIDIQVDPLGGCQGDLGQDGWVNQADLALFAGVFCTARESEPYCRGDFDGDMPLLDIKSPSA